MLRHTKRQVFFYNMRCFVMFVTVVCILFLENKSLGPGRNLDKFKIVRHTI